MALILLSIAGVACAIDNPDAPDRVAAFEIRAAPFEQQLAATDGGSAATREGRTYALFLNTELNTAYRALLAQLRDAPRKALIESQRQWLRFRDTELRFIEVYWTPERSGSSANLSRAGYSNAVAKERILQLLRYSAEYP